MEHSLFWKSVYFLLVLETAQIHNPNNKASQYNKVTFVVLVNYFFTLYQMYFCFVFSDGIKT